jgi:hypothetical protein
VISAVILVGACLAGTLWPGQPAAGARRAQFPSIILDTHDPAAESVGFTTLDATPSELAQLPPGARVLVWLGGYDNSSCTWTTSDSQLRASFDQHGLASDARVAGYFLADEPNTDHHCPGAPGQLRARTALVRSLDPNTRHYALANIDDPDQFAAFQGTVDVLATDPYPCRVGAACDWAQIPSYIARLRAAGVTRYMGFLQAFSGQSWRWPTPTELIHMVDQWRASDWCGAITFSWSYQGQALSDHPQLLKVLAAFNADLPVPPRACGATA